MEDEWQMGQQLEQDIAQQVRLVNDAAIVNYVRQMGQKIVSQTPMANLPWKFHVIADPEINAFNAPGGLVYINTGLIAAAANASELAGVIAHEITHGVERHGTERLSAQYGTAVVASLVLGQDPGVLQQIAAQVAAGGAIASYSRNAEREADRDGVRYMRAAGYNPEGMATMFEKLLAERSRRPNALESFFSTHPLTEERIANVRSEIRRGGLSGGSTNESGFARAKSRAQAVK